MVCFRHAGYCKPLFKPVRPLDMLLMLLLLQCAQEWLGLCTLWYSQQHVLCRCHCREGQAAVTEPQQQMTGCCIAGVCYQAAARNATASHQQGQQAWGAMGWRNECEKVTGASWRRMATGERLFQQAEVASLGIHHGCDLGACNSSSSHQQQREDRTPVQHMNVKQGADI
jgi:hypothetical protein